uniref:Ribonuclease P protein subunit p20 n=1 Tax=Knipowitschia caucasica TaxID=637954 RepID=A0AAV2KSK3_KNICA
MQKTGCESRAEASRAEPCRAQPCRAGLRRAEPSRSPCYRRSSGQTRRCLTMSDQRPSAPTPAVEAPPPAVDMDPVEYTLRKRLPRKLPKRRNDVYVNMKTDFRAQLARCQKLLEGGGHREICVHGLGLAINRAINIALQLQASSQGALQLATNTSTVELVDDLEPEDPDETGETLTRTRNNSAIHIKVFYPEPQ